MPRKPPLDQLVSLLSELFCQMFKDLCSLTLLSPSFKLLTTCYPVNTLKRLMESTRHIRNVKIHHVWADREFLCLLWQNCRRPWSFTCEPCSFDSGTAGFVWARRVWNGSANPKSPQIRGAFRHKISQRKSEIPAEIHIQIFAVYGNLMNRQIVTEFLHLKKHLAGKNFDDDDEVQEEVMTWCKGQAADFYDSGIKKLVPRLNKCLNNAGQYVEK